MAGDESKDYFISYNKVDHRWAEWIAFELEAVHYTTIIQAWDIRPGSNFVAEMDEAAKRAERTIPVLSPAYLTSGYAFAEWAAAFRHDPKGKLGKVLPVRIERCVVEGLLEPIVYIDLVDLDESQAREHLLAGVKRGRAKPASVAFPGSSTYSFPLDHPAFPGSLPQRQGVLSPQKSLATGREEKAGTRPMGHEQVWNVPYSRNPVFTGRESLLVKLAEALHKNQAAALTQPQAISGLGGIGKTQVALEYAYRFRGDYQAVLWVQADTPENLTSSYLTLAALLNLPEKDEQESAQVITAVKNWLQRATNWLLILDNADDLTLARDFLPPSRGGHVLLTTRAHPTVRFARRVEVDILSAEVGALFLLRRSGLLAPGALFEQASEDERNGASVICEELGGLPLALDQAGAYIEETGCGLAEYVHLYHERSADLLAQRRGLLVNDHPDPVTTTWSLSFTQVEKKNQMAAELLRFCAFLAADAIPEELFTPIAMDIYQFNQAIEILRAYSLIKRDPASKTLTVHRLVQKVMRDALPVEVQHEWTQYVVLAISKTFPYGRFENWSRCERLLPHALLCVRWIEQNTITAPEVGRLLNLVAYYLGERGRYSEIELLHGQGLAILEHQEQVDERAIATSLAHLGYFYMSQGRYAEAEPVLKRALTIDENVYGPEHTEVATDLNNLAALVHKQGEYAEAEPLYRRALDIRERLLGPEHPDTIRCLNNLAALFHQQGKYADAESLYRGTLEIRERVLGPEHPETVSTLINLAALFHQQGKYAKAEPMYQRGLRIYERVLGQEHPDTASTLNRLATLYAQQGKHTEAKLLYQQALEICKQRLGLEHPYTQMIQALYAGADLLQRMTEEG